MLPQNRLKRVLALTVLLAVTTHATLAQDAARGFVYHDSNGDGKRGNGESGIAGVGVSNGEDVVLTGSDGSYELSVETDSIVFVIKPTNWRTAMDEKKQLPRYYYNHKPGGSPESKFPGVAPTGELPASVDFPLYPQEESDTFKVIFFGDPQPRNIEEVNYIAHDIVEELIGFDAAFGVTLGDIVFNDLSVLPVLNGVIGRIGAPWYNVIGNHDLNMDTDLDSESDETFERIYGPAYYSLNYGEVHFIVLDDVVWNGDGYTGGIGERQLAFVRNDLKHVDEDRLVVVMMHIPLMSVGDKDELLHLLEGHANTFSVSAHWHRQGTFFVENKDDALDDHHHLVHGTVSGSWWSGLKDEFGIPHAFMSDGTPNGYSVATFKGNTYSLKYKAARRPADFQMSIFAPESVTVAEAANHEVIVNVFMGSSQSKVEMRVGEDGAWSSMKQTEREDPYFQALKAREYYLPPAAGRKLPGASKSTHVWAANLPANLAAGTHVIHVRTTDMFGQVFEDERIIRVE
jgi:hypothetical protein